MSVHDAAGAAAALARVESGAESTETARSFFADAGAEWRAVGVRGLVRPQDRLARERALLDPNPDVRGQAVRAAREAQDMLDFGALAEAARADPESSVRAEAVRALGALPSRPGNRQVADALRDLWVSGQESFREDIARAWSSPAEWAAGGKEALRYAVNTARGAPAIQAAAAVLRHRDAGATQTNEAVARLAEQIAQGTQAERLHALDETPMDHEALVAAVTAAAKDDDPAVRVAALARLAGLAGAERANAVTELEALAQPGASTASRARFALAVAGDRRVQFWLEQSLEASASKERLDAAEALVRLGVAARAAPLLADSDPQVRLRAACAIMTGKQ
jgi:HEAT repeat protein